MIDVRELRIGNYVHLFKSLISQEAIFSKQLEKHICHKCPEVAVLSAFPLYVLDYFGCERTITKLNS